MAMSLQDLIASTKKFKPDLFINANRIPKVDSLKITRFVGTRSILYSAMTRDVEGPAAHSSSSNKPRSVQIQFTVPKGEDVKSYTPSIKNDRVLVRSESPYYRFAFQYNNKKNKAHFGKIKPFKVKGTGKPINPENYPGIDKHLIALTKAMQDNKLIKE